MTIVWIVLGVAGAGLCWFLFKGALGFATPPEKSGRALLLQRLKQNGIPPHTIPYEAIDEIVASCLQTAQGVAGFVGNKGKYGAWRANFVDQIEGAVVCIGSLLKREKHYAVGPLYKILVKHGVCK